MHGDILSSAPILGHLQLQNFICQLVCNAVYVSALITLYIHLAVHHQEQCTFAPLDCCSSSPLLAD
jgi:hypothetical protein